MNFDLQAETEYNDYENSMRDMKRGVANHVLIGHGPTQNTFEKRDFATTNDMVYDRRNTVEQMIDPNTFQNDMGKTRSKQQINTQGADLPSMFGASGKKPNAKHYNQFTTKFDNNSLKLGLRQ